DGLDGTMTFSKVKDSEIYKADKNNNRFIVKAKVLLTDPSTKFEYVNEYLLVDKRKDQRYVVESLNDEEYVYNIIEKHLEDKEKGDKEEKSDESNENENENNDEYNYQDSNQDDDS